MPMQKRIAGLYFLFLFLAATMLCRLFVLSQGNKATETLSGQYTRKISIAERRGFLFYRDGSLLSDETDGYLVFVNPARVQEDVNTAADTLFPYTNVEYSALIEKLEDGAPFCITANTKIDLPYAHTYPSFRTYQGKTARHLIGYLDADGHGVTGLLQTYDPMLVGELSGTVTASYEANAKRSIMEDGPMVVADEGYSKASGLVLTLDQELQQKAEALADEYMQRGAILVGDMETGELLAVVSRPVYDTQNLAASLSSDAGDFLNRAFCAFTPGSIFKTVVAAAALRADPSLYRFTYECVGHLDVSGENFNCHKLSGHGVETMKEGFANSCNTYFISLANQVGLSRIFEMARDMGVGAELLPDGPPIQSGSLPEDEYCTPAFLANLSFGQGRLLITPLEALNIVRVSMTGKTSGWTCIRGTERNGELIPFQQEKIENAVLPPEVLPLMKSLFTACMEEGTGTRAMPQDKKAGGKTATAQTGQFDSEGEELLHLWFVGAYPMDRPRYAIVAMCDGAGGKDQSAADIFKELTEFIAARGQTG